MSEKIYKGIRNGTRKGKQFAKPSPMIPTNKAFRKLQKRIKIWEAEGSKGREQGFRKPGSMQGPR